MAKGLGSDMGNNFALRPFKKSARRKAKGLYPNSETGLGQYGSVQFPTIIEQYNRQSDYKRWKLGQEYYFGEGRTWGDLQLSILARFHNANSSLTDEINSQGSKEVVTLFPSDVSPENTWYVATRVRGSFMFPSAIQLSDITINNTDPDPAKHTFTYNVSSQYNTDQLAIFYSVIGDVFEDSASGPNFPDDLVRRDVGSLGFTLVGVSLGSMTLTFDLSRPYRRVERNKTIYWSKEKYDPEDPPTWRTDGSRHLCSAFSFFCCCPDHLGGALANLDSPEPKATLETFPLPNANRSVFSAWEKEGVGYYRQWRSLGDRRDDRRECKHIHAQRWACGCPWLEPDDYPTQSDRDFLEFLSESERSMKPNEFISYFRNRQLSWDRFILTLAESSGLVIFPGGDVRDNVRPSVAPMLWNDKDQPLTSWCRNNDWWMERGTQKLQSFNQSINSFSETVSKNGVEYPVISFLEPGDPGSPVIVP